MSAPLRFRRLGRGWHPCIEDGHDLAGVLDLDEALWIATAAPVGSLRADPVFLACLDTDKDGRIRTDEVRAGIRWLLANLRDPGDIRTGDTTLRLASLPDESRDLLASARLVLERTAAPSSEQVTLDAVRVVRSEEVARGLAEAGCVHPSAAADPDLESFLTHIVETTGGAPHPELTVTAASMAQFLAEARAWTLWHERGAPGADGSHAVVLPLGSVTPAAWNLCQSLSAKVDHYFVLCDAVRLDVRLASYTLPDPTGTDLLDAAATSALLSRAPIAVPRADGRLSLVHGINPAYEAPIAFLLTEVVWPMLGADVDTLDRAAWIGLLARLSAYAGWMAEKPITRVGRRSPEEIKRHSADATLVTRAQALIDASHVTAARIARLEQLEQLMLYQAWMLPFVNSFVSCRDLYDPAARALFGWGTLVLDGRWFNLAVKVPDATRHEGFTKRGALCVMYVEVGDVDEDWEYEVAVPVTAGMRGFLVEGMWGVFVEHGTGHGAGEGRERHARVRKIVVHPISMRDAIFSPFRRLMEAFQGAVDKAGAAEEAAALDKVLASTRLDASPGPVAAAPPPDAPVAAARPAAAAGVLAIAAGAGIALAAISSALAYIGDRFVAAASTIGAWIIALPMVNALPASTIHTVGLAAYPAAVVVVILGMLAVPMLVYLLPVCIAAWLKLRRRDLGSLLIGSGWAVNSRLYISRKVGHMFTEHPSVPRSQRQG
ncbi:MAG: hypothetical protein V4850_33430 [Myxococcota bacterium]